jgi:hypothetical protein
LSWWVSNAISDGNCPHRDCVSCRLRGYSMKMRLPTLFHPAMRLLQRSRVAATCEIVSLGARNQAVKLLREVGWCSMYRTPYVAERLSAFRRLVAYARSWTAIGADAEYGVVLSGGAQAFPRVFSWMEHSAWRLGGSKAFVPARDCEKALIIGDALSLAFATLAQVMDPGSAISEGAPGAPRARVAEYPYPDRRADP